MTTPQQPMSTRQLRQANDLTRLSTRPGSLDYNAYRQYLIVNGHVKETHRTNLINAPVKALNTNLQPQSVDRIDNKTDFRADQALWAQDALPEFLYVFEQPIVWLEKGLLREAPRKKYKVYGVFVKDLPILPDHISSKVEGWRVEAWMRYDPRVSLMDIMDRMDPSSRPNNKSVIQMRTLRFRADCSILGWVAIGKNFEQRKQEIIQQMHVNGIDPDQNSTRGISWGLIDTVLGEIGGRIEVPESRRLPNTVDMAASSIYSIPPATVLMASTSSTTSTSSTKSTNTRGPAKAVTTAATVPQPAPSTPPHQIMPSTWSRGKPQWPNNAGEHFRDIKSRLDNIFFSRSLYQDETPSPPQIVQTAPPATRTTVSYHGSPLILKTAEERQRDAAFVDVLRRQWHPARSEGRRLQLSYILDPTRLHRGFIDNRGWWPPVGGEANMACIDGDILYG